MSRQHYKIRSGLLLKGITGYPSDAEEGDLVYRSDLYKYSVYRNGNWADLLDDRQLSLLATTDNTTTGSSAVISTTPTPYIRLTNASLVSIAGITAPAAVLNSQMITLSNNTGVPISLIHNDVGTLGAQRIYTGAGGTIVMLNQSTVTLIYDATNSRWMVISGSGGSTTLFATVGEAAGVTAGQALYLKTSDSKVYKLDASQDTTMEFLGIAADAGIQNATIRVQLVGEISAGSGLTVGKPVFADPATAGGYTSTAPNTIGYWLIQVGIATSATKFAINAAASATAQKITTFNSDKYINILTKTAAYTTVDGDECIRCDATSAGFTLSLHIAVIGTIIRIKKIDSTANIVTVDANSADTIDGALTYPLATQYEELTLVKVSTSAWEIF